MAVLLRSKLSRAHTADSPERRTERTHGPEAHRDGDLLDCIASSQHGHRMLRPNTRDPLPEARSGFRVKNACDGSGAHIQSKSPLFERRRIVGAISNGAHDRCHQLGLRYADEQFSGCGSENIEHHRLRRDTRGIRQRLGVETIEQQSKHRGDIDADGIWCDRRCLLHSKLRRAHPSSGWKPSGMQQPRRNPQAHRRGDCPDAGADRGGGCAPLVPQQLVGRMRMLLEPGVSCDYLVPTVDDIRHRDLTGRVDRERACVHRRHAHEDAMTGVSLTREIPLDEGEKI